PNSSRPAKNHLRNAAGDRRWRMDWPSHIPTQEIASATTVSLAIDRRSPASMLTLTATPALKLTTPALGRVLPFRDRSLAGKARLESRRPPWPPLSIR